MWPPFNWRTIVDFLVLCLAFYVVLRWAARARALRIALTITILYAVSLVARHFDLVITSWVLQGAALVAVAMLVLVFQPELRRALLELDRRFLAWPPRAAAGEAANLRLAGAAFALAAQRVGALFVIVKRDPISELVEDGVSMAAEVSPGLVDAIFQKSSPLHDGAVVIEAGRIAKAAAILPLTQRSDVPPSFGTRHRAAMGLAERSDAIVIVVSEERGEVTVMRGRSVLLMNDIVELASLLDRAIVRSERTVGARLRDVVTTHWKYKLAALGLASLIWSVATFETGSAVRTVNVPIEFRNVPRGLDIAEQSDTTIEVQLRGRTWVMDSISLGRLVAAFDLRGTREGLRKLDVRPGALALPPGVSMMRVTPAAITVLLAKHAGAAR